MASRLSESKDDSRGRTVLSCYQNLMSLFIFHELRGVVITLFYLISILVVIADQAAKWWIRSNMQLGETLPVWSGHLQFTYYENSGAAFSSFQGYGKYFAIIAVLFVAAIFYYRRKGELRGTVLEAASGFLAGGALGNAIDRVIYHQVTDFLVFGSQGGILNLADLAINAGGLLVLVHLLKEPLKRVILKR